MTVTALELKQAIRERELDLGVDVDMLSVSTPLAEQGVDSLGVMDILLLLKEEYGVKVSDADVSRMISLEAIAAYLDERGVARPGLRP